MIFTLSFIALKAFATIILIITLNTGVSAQVTPPNDSARIKNNLSFYHSITPDKNNHIYQRVDYSRPKNQFMSWADAPLTATQIEQRNEKWKVDNKLPDIIVRDIVQSFLSKKKKVAVVPKF
ncbi:MAG: hypothetical protein WDM90_10145 [Ferruginibacter sp.]